MALPYTALARQTILSYLARKALRENLTLLEEIQKYQDDAALGLQSGRVLIATSGAGHSAQFHDYKTGDPITPDDPAALAALFVNAHADALTALAAAGNSSPTDTQTLAQMLLDDALQSATDYRPDFSSYSLEGAQD